MAVRGNQVFPVGYDWARLGALCALALALFVLGDTAFAERGAAGVAGRLIVAALFVPLALSARSGSAPRSAWAVTAACSLGARAGADSSRAASNTRRPAAGECHGRRHGRTRSHEHERPERRHLVVIGEPRAEALVARVARAAQRDVPAVRDRAVQSLQGAHDQLGLGTGGATRRGQGVVAARIEHARGERLVVAEEEVVACEIGAQVRRSAGRGWPWARAQASPRKR